MKQETFYSQTSTTASISSENKSEELETKSKSDNQNNDSNSNNTNSNDQNTNSNSNNTGAQKHFNYTMDSSKYNEFLTKLNTIEKNDAEGNAKAATTYDITMYAYTASLTSLGYTHNRIKELLFFWLCLKRTLFLELSIVHIWKLSFLSHLADAS